MFIRKTTLQKLRNTVESQAYTIQEQRKLIDLMADEIASIRKEAKEQKIASVNTIRSLCFDFDDIMDVATTNFRNGQLASRCG